MNKIQYKVIQFKGGRYLEDKTTITSLNKIGKDGWILVSLPEIDSFSMEENDRSGTEKYKWNGVFYRPNGKVDGLS